MILFQILEKFDNIFGKMLSIKGLETFEYNIFYSKIITLQWLKKLF